MAELHSKIKLRGKKRPHYSWRSQAVKTGGVKVGDCGLVDHHYGPGYAEMERREYARVYFRD